MEELNRHPDTAEVSTSNDAPEEYEPPEEALEQDDAELDSDFQEPEVTEEDEDEDTDEDIDSQELEAPAPEEPLEEESADAISEDPQPLTEVQDEPLEENISDEEPLTEVSDEAPLTEPEEAPVTEEPLTENLQDPDAQELPPPQEPENTPEPVSQSPDSLEDRELQEPVATEAQPAPDAEERSAQDRMGDYLAEHNYGPDDYAEYSKDPEWQQLNNDLREELGMEPLSYERSAQDRMGDYLSEHNYGPDDYAEYSKDPEWQQLNNDLREELGMEPLSYERSAQDRMGDYLSEHNYGPDDYAEYSKDPEWQQLNNDLQKELGIEPTDYSAVENLERMDGVRDITQPYYDEARDVAKNSPENGRYYTDHGEDHVEMAADKSLEAGDAIQDSIRSGAMRGENTPERVAFSPDIDKSTLEGAALSHDTGMSGNGYALGERRPDGSYEVRPEDNSNFDEVRSNHSLNSALNILENREKYQALGYNDNQIDKMAAECMAHSKSSSGVQDLNSKENWSDCFNRMDSAVDAYNRDHPDKPISFDRSFFEKNDENLGSLASETLALRIGDVSRDSKPGAITQTGESVQIDRSTINDHGGSVFDEIKDADITIGENNDVIDSDNIKSRQVHAGEQNITGNRTFADGDGMIVHEVTVHDGASAPKCTQEALSDHIGELATAKDGAFRMDVKFDSPCDEIAQEYDSFRREIYADPDQKYSNVEITFPWDRR